MKPIPEKHFHDVCPKCGSPSVPAEKVPDQTLRGCLKCLETFTEDLDRPASVAAMVENNF